MKNHSSNNCILYNLNFKGKIYNTKYFHFSCDSFFKNNSRIKYTIFQFTVFISGKPVTRKSFSIYQIFFHICFYYIVVNLSNINTHATRLSRFYYQACIFYFRIFDSRTITIQQNALKSHANKTYMRNSANIKVLQFIRCINQYF